MKPRITPNRKRVLSILYEEGPMDEFKRQVCRVQRRTLSVLSEEGLAKYRPYGKPPSWVITPHGRLFLRSSARLALTDKPQVSA